MFICMLVSFVIGGILCMVMIEAEHKENAKLFFWSGLGAFTCMAIFIVLFNMLAI